MKLYVLYKKPTISVEKDSSILSFLKPSEEQSFVESSNVFVFYGRKEMNLIREQARLLYIDMVSRTGATTCDGFTLRQAVSGKEKSSVWWYHKFSEKDVESDPTFNKILQIITIKNVAKKIKASEIIFCGDAEDITAAFSKSGLVKGKVRSTCLLSSICKGIGSRVKYLFRELADKLFIHLYTCNSDIKPDLVFEGFWEWSVFYKSSEEKIMDNYFGSLPEKLKSRGFECAWLVWFMNDYGPKYRGKEDIIRKAHKQKEIIFLQRFISVIDIITNVFNVLPLIKYLKIRTNPEFREIFIRDNIDFWPIINEQLDYGFCNSTIPHYKLVEIAAYRAFSKYKPSILITFLEFFVHSRAFYQAGKQYNNSLISCTIQHASYNREKMFGILHKEMELNGNPDGCAIPVPYYIFAMGELGYELFLESGFNPEQVFLTGVPRYDDINLSSEVNLRAINNFTILIVTTLDRSNEIEMINAVVAAVDGLNANLYLRSHPMAPMEEMSEFAKYSKKIVLTHGSLDEDLKKADLIIFTYTTVAETAMIKGIPVFQWVPAGFNGSVFRELKIIPTFCTVEELRQGIKTFINNPKDFEHSEETKQLVLRKCFYKIDGAAADRISQVIHDLLG